MKYVPFSSQSLASEQLMDILQYDMYDHVHNGT